MILLDSSSLSSAPATNHFIMMVHFTELILTQFAILISCICGNSHQSQVRALANMLCQPSKLISDHIHSKSWPSICPWYQAVCGPEEVAGQAPQIL